VIYFARCGGGRRVRFSCKTTDWNEAAELVSVWEARAGLRALPKSTFGAMIDRYLAEDLPHLAPTTQENRREQLRVLGVHFGRDRDLASITKADIRAWWQSALVAGGRKRSEKTLRTWIDALAAVYRLALESDAVEQNPVAQFRATLNMRRNTQRARAEAEQFARPIEDLAAFVEASAAVGGAVHALNITLLDSGLRMGEAQALTWGDIDWERNLLDVNKSLSRGKHLGPTKSGRSRRVQLSRRAKALLRELQLVRGRPAPSARIWPGVDQRNYAQRAFGRICKAAGLGHRRPKDLRDSYASHLLTLGVPVAYISRQLGHANVGVTTRHYARWCGGDEYRPGPVLAPGEVPTDLLARVGHPSTDAERASG
jgi:integrase